MLIRGLFTLLCCLTLVPAWPAHATYVSVTNSAADLVSDLSNTLAVTVTAGTNLLVIVEGHRDSDNASPVTSATFNGSETFTKATDRERNASGVRYGCAIWYLKAPTITTANVVVNWSVVPDFAQIYSVLQFSGMATGTVTDAVSGADGATSGASQTVSSSITTVANTDIVDCLFTQDDEPPTVGAGQSQKVNRPHTGVDDQHAVSVVENDGGGAETMDWVMVTSGQHWVHVAASFLRAAVASRRGSVPLVAQ